MSFGQSLHRAGRTEPGFRTVLTLYNLDDGGKQPDTRRDRPVRSRTVRMDSDSRCHDPGRGPGPGLGESEEVFD